MAKARARTTTRKVKDRWRAKTWYNVIAPPAFDNATVSETLADVPDNLINRIASVSLQDLTNDFRKSHILLYFKIHKVDGSNAHTQFTGHSLTSDYIRRMIRRRNSKIDAVYDVETKDRGTIRVKPFAMTDKRIQNSQRRAIRSTMKDTIAEEASKSTMSEFIKNTIDGKLGSDIYKNCKKLYPVKRIEIGKTEVIKQPTIELEEKKPKKKEEKTEEKPEKEAKKPKKEEVKEEVKKEKTEEAPKEKEEKPKKEVEKKIKKETKKTTAKPKKVKTPAKKATAKKPAAKKTTKPTKAKSKPAKKKTTKKAKK